VPFLLAYCCCRADDARYRTFYNKMPAQDSTRAVGEFPFTDLRPECPTEGTGWKSKGLESGEGSGGDCSGSTSGSRTPVLDSSSILTDVDYYWTIETDFPVEEAANAGKLVPFGRVVITFRRGRAWAVMSDQRA
jgi:hypothetical protein